MFEKKGFTALEVLVVVGILVFLTAVVIFFVNPVELMKSSRDARRISELTTIDKILETVDQAGSFDKDGPLFGSPGETIYIELLKDESKGGYFNKYIRDQYQSSRVS